jgi:hypothetical protein
MPAKFQTEPLPLISSQAQRKVKTPNFRGFLWNSCGMTVHQIHGRETPHSTRKVAQLILRPLATENFSKWQAVISAKQQQINEAPVNTLKNLFLEERTGRPDAKSGLAGRCHHRLWPGVY